MITKAEFKQCLYDQESLRFEQSKKIEGYVDDLFGKLEKLTASGSGAMPAWLMSHPKTADRIAAIERLEAGWRKAGLPKT